MLSQGAGPKAFVATIISNQTCMSNENTNKIIKQLREIGLKQNEAEIYLFLLQNGISTPPQIAKGTNIARTNCYNILKSLQEKDVVDLIEKGKRDAYVARDPESLKLSIERKLESIERVLPDLQAAYVVQKNKPGFRFFDGWEEVKNIYGLTLESKEIYAIGSTERLLDLDLKFFENYVKTVDKKGIKFNDLLTHTSKQKSGPLIESLTNSLYSTCFIPEKYGENLTDILIWEDNIALITLEEPIFGTVITSKPLADTFRTIINALRDLITTN